MASDSADAAPMGDKPLRLRDALREARIEQAERTAVIVDLRDAEAARLHILNEALDPLFAEIPERIDLFDRGISQGDTPRLWIDSVAHIVMGHDKRIYRFVQDTRFGRVTIAESHSIPVIANAVTRYVARRMIEREKAMAPTTVAEAAPSRTAPARRFAWSTFALGLVLGAVGLVVLAILLTGG